MKINYLKFSILLSLTVVKILISQHVNALVVPIEPTVIAAATPFNMVYDHDLKFSPEPTKSTSVANDDSDDYMFYENSNYLQDYDINDDEKRSSRIHVFRRGCIRRNGACDHRPNDCCFNTSCRCNLWGSNCRCQRVGLFQKWG